MRLLITALLLTLASPVRNVEGVVLTPEKVTELENFVTALMACHDIPGHVSLASRLASKILDWLPSEEHSPGLSLAVVRGNETWTRGFGLADKTNGRTVDSATRFGIGSITKSFAAALASQFLDESEGRTWQTPVVNILGDDLKLATDDITRQVTLKDLLSHRTGLNSAMIPMMAGLPKDLTSEQLIKRFRLLPMELPFRDEMRYNNWPYGLAGRVTEVMGGASWEELLHTRLFQPLGMTESGIMGKTVTVEADNVAQPYVRVGKQVVPLDPSACSSIAPLDAAGAIVSSADDMAKWLRMHINKGKTPEGMQVLDEQYLREMYKVIVPLPDIPIIADIVYKPLFPVSFVHVGYGLGWFTAVYRGYRVKWHAGNLFAYTSNLFYLPDMGIGFYLAVNGPGDMGSFVANQMLSLFITDLLVDQEPWLNVSTACSFPEPWLQMPAMDQTVTAGEVDDPNVFVGTYGHGLFGNVEILNSKEGLRLSFGRFITGKLHKSAVSNVLLLEMDGITKFLSATKDRIVYINATFTEAAEDGKYDGLLLSFPDFGFPETTSFKRGVKFEGWVHDEL